MNLSDVALAAQTAQKESLTLAEKGITSAKVVLTGFVVVFVMLILLIFIIKIFSAIVQKAQSAGSNSKKGKKNKDEKPAEKPAAAPRRFNVRDYVPGWHCLRLPVEPDKHLRSLHGRQPSLRSGSEHFYRCRLLSLLPVFYNPLRPVAGR